MSTKIHHGFIIRGCDLEAVESVIFNDTFSDALTASAKERLQSAFSERFIELVDLEGFNSEEAVKRALVDVNEGIQEAREGYRSAYDVEIAFSYKAYQGNIYLLNYTDNNVLYDRVTELLRILGIKEYAYYNNVDKPSNLTHEEWQARSSSWDHVIDKGSPDKSGFRSFTLNLDQAVIDSVSFDLSAVSIDKRSSRYALNKVIQVLADKAKENGEIMQMSEVMSAITDINTGRRYTDEMEHFRMEFLSSDYYGKGDIKTYPSAP